MKAPINRKKKAAGVPPKQQVIEEDEEIESSSDNLSEHSSEDDDDEDFNDDDNHRLARMAEEVYPEEKAPKPRKQVKSKSGSENEFRASHTHKLTLNELLLNTNAEEEEIETGQGLLKKQLASQSNSKFLLQPRVQDVDAKRADRRVGYEQATEQVTEHWQDVVVNNKKKAKLTFPLQEQVNNTSIRNVVAKSTLQSGLELEIAQVLETCGLSEEKDIVASEFALGDDAEPPQLDDDTKSKMRALLFYQEQKAKRIAKIKSKTFRKLRKKRLSKEEDLALEELRRTDPELAKEEDERLAMDRAKERATLRHKNTSKNMRELGKRFKLEDKMKSLTKREDGSDSDSDDDDKTGERLAWEHLQQVEAETSQAPPVSKGLAGMKFMQRALEQEQKLAKTEALALWKRMRKDTEDDDQDEDDTNSAVTLKGRVKFDSAVSQPLDSDAAAPPSLLFPEKEPIVVVKPGTVKLITTAATKGTLGKEDADDDEDDDDESNPWLGSSSAKSLRQKKKKREESTHEETVLRVLDSAAAVVEKNALQAQKHAEQEEMVKLAFSHAGEVDFAKEKERILEEEKKAEALPSAHSGWGSWTGFGIKQTKPLPPVAVKHPVVLDAKPHVMVSARTNKLHKKYQVDKVPYPFTSQEQYLQSLSNPIGPEWNTVKQHAKKVMPSVEVKPGTIVQPIQLPKAKIGTSKQIVVPLQKQKVKFASRKAMS